MLNVLDETLQQYELFLGRNSQHANQTSETHNIILGGTAMNIISTFVGPIENPIEKFLYIETSLGVETEKPLFIQVSYFPLFDVYYALKLRYSEKATKIWKNSPR